MTAGFTPRPPFASLPYDVVAALESALGSRIADVRDRHGGMSPGPAAALGLADGRRLFVKAVSAEVNPISARLYADELDALPRLGTHVPHARLVAGLHHGPWCVVATTLVDGDHPGPPWTRDGIDATLAAIDRLGAAPPGLPELTVRAPALDGWRELSGRDPSTLPGWERDRVDRLADLESDWQLWTAGETLVHFDVRGDNAIAGPDGVVLVDWSFAVRGADWVDRAILAIEPVVSRSSDALELAARCLDGCPPEANRFVVAYAGMWRRNSERPEHPGMTTHRAWQRDRARALRPLLDHILTTT